MDKQNEALPSLLFTITGDIPLRDLHRRDKVPGGCRVRASGRDQPLATIRLFGGLDFVPASACDLFAATTGAFQFRGAHVL